MKALSIDDLTEAEVETKVNQMVKKRKERDAKTGLEWIRNNPDKKRATENRKNAKNKSLKKYHCATCDRAFNNQSRLNKHNNTAHHKKKVAGPGPLTATAKAHAEARASKKYYCALCERAFPTNSGLAEHYRTDKHIFKATAAKKAAKSSL